MKMKQSPGKIYLSEERGLCQTGQHSRYSTFNFGSFYNQHKEAFGSLYVFNEEMLAGGQSITLRVEAASYVILLPIIGGVNFFDLQGNVSGVDVKEILISYLPKNRLFRIDNPYPSDAITFLQIWIKAHEPSETAVSWLYRYSFESLEHQLFEIAPSKSAGEIGPAFPFSVTLGRFAGREEVRYTLKNKACAFFAFVIGGAFEAAGRLLHEKDGLALWDTEEVELEALSNNALVVVLEVSG